MPLFLFIVSFQQFPLLFPAEICYDIHRYHSTKEKEEVMKKYIRNIHTLLSNVEKPFSTLFYKGLYFSIAVCLLATFLLFGYIACVKHPLLYEAGFMLLQSGLFFGSLFYIFAIAFDGIVKKLV